MRFRKSIRLAPGLRLNFTGSGVSATIGPRGASVSVGKRGTFLNSGIPGTGFYSRQRLGGSSPSIRGGRYVERSVSVKVGIGESGDVYFHDAAGNPLADSVVAKAKKQQGEAIRQLIQDRCEEINAAARLLSEIHLDTPAPTRRPTYTAKAFDVPPPRAPTKRKPGLLGRLFSSRRERIENENRATETEHQLATSEWEQAMAAFQQAEAKRRDMIERAIYADATSMEVFLGDTLAELEWPRETIVSVEVPADRCSVFLDVDLPEIEDFPRSVASVPQRGWKVSIKEMPATQLQRLYMQHVHGIGFRLIGHAFATLPNVREVVVSGFSQRQDRTSGNPADEYLYSVRVDRNAWASINFDNLAAVDPVEALGRFDLRRRITKSGRFSAIEPFAPVD